MRSLWVGETEGDFARERRRSGKPLGTDGTGNVAYRFDAEIRSPRGDEDDGVTERLARRHFQAKPSPRPGHGRAAVPIFEAVVERDLIDATRSGEARLWRHDDALDRQHFVVRPPHMSSL